MYTYICSNGKGFVFEESLEAKCWRPAMSLFLSTIILHLPIIRLDSRVNSIRTIQNNWFLKMPSYAETGRGVSMARVRLFLRIINLHLRKIRHNSCNKLSPHHSDHPILNMDTWRLQESVCVINFHSSNWNVKRVFTFINLEMGVYDNKYTHTYTHTCVSLSWNRIYIYVCVCVCVCVYVCMCVSECEYMSSLSNR